MLGRLFSLLIGAKIAPLPGGKISIQSRSDLDAKIGRCSVFSLGTRSICVDDKHDKETPFLFPYRLNADPGKKGLLTFSFSLNTTNSRRFLAVEKISLLLPLQFLV